MKVFGRKLLDYNTPIEVDFDELVFQKDGKDIVVSLRSFLVEGELKVRSTTGPLMVHPQDSNHVLLKTTGYENDNGTSWPSHG